MQQIPSVVSPAWCFTAACNYLNSKVDDSVTTGRVSHIGQVMNYEPKERNKPTVF